MDKDKENSGDSRRELLETLGEVVSVALIKYGRVTARNKDRQGWARVIVSAIGEAAKIMKDVELDELEGRISKLEEVLK